MAVRVITDSSAGLPPGLAAERGVLVVPLTVTAGPRSGAEGVDVSAADVRDALEAGLAVRTAQPGPAAFQATLAAAGHDEVVAVHLSGALSGTVDAARSAVGGRGEVVDSRTCGMGLGFVALAAARAAGAGRSRADVVAAATAAMRRTHVWFSVESLDALRRGGRIGAASALLGSVLAVRPLLHLVDGVVQPLEKVRTASRALARLQAVAAETVSRGGVDAAVMHLGAPGRAEQLAAGLRASLPGLADLWVTELSAAVGAHTGLGAVGLAVTER